MSEINISTQYYMGSICRYLSIEELKTVRLVNQGWKTSANRELEIRCETIATKIFNLHKQLEGQLEGIEKKELESSQQKLESLNQLSNLFERYRVVEKLKLKVKHSVYWNKQNTPSAKEHKNNFKNKSGEKIYCKMAILKNEKIIIEERPTTSFLKIADPNNRYLRAHFFFSAYYKTYENTYGYPALPINTLETINEEEVTQFTLINKEPNSKSDIICSVKARQLEYSQKEEESERFEAKPFEKVVADALNSLSSHD